MTGNESSIVAPFQTGVVLAEMCSAGARSSEASEARDSFGLGSTGKGRFDSVIPSKRLEQEAQTLGFRERVLILFAKGSPQQMQIRGSMPC